MVIRFSHWHQGRRQVLKSGPFMKHGKLSFFLPPNIVAASLCICRIIRIIRTRKFDASPVRINSLEVTLKLTHA